jgi:flagella basal body P-ring formation protein FlgA
MSRYATKILGLIFLLVMLGVATASAVDTDEAIVQLMRDTYGLDSGHYDIEVNSNQLKTRMVLPGDLSLRAFSPKEPLGPFTIDVTITHRGEEIERGQVRLRINKFDEVMVALDKIGRHELLAEDQFEQKRMNVTSLREQPVTSPDQIDEQRSRRNLRRGTILTTGAMEPVPDIEVGGEVTIICQDTWGIITAPGKALQDGWSGDRIRVKNLASNKMIDAVVTADGRVRVDP